MRLEVVVKPLGVGALVAGAVSCGEPSGSEHDRRAVQETARTDADLRAPAPPVWGGEQKLVAGDAAEFDQMGYGVSLAGERALVGAYGDDLYRGTAYVFRRGSSAFEEEQKLVASDGGEDDYFGWSTSLGEDRALVGAYADDAYRGAAYVFVRNGTAWTEEQKLVASDGATGDQFGWSLSLAGDRALIGSVGNDAARGAAYVFVRNGATWTEEQKLVASNGVAGDKFGYAISLAPDRALVGATSTDARRGAAYVFVRSGESFTEEQMLVASDGVADDHFGVSVTLAADRAMVGAYWDDSLRGSVYGFVRSGSAWSEEQKLVASDGEEGHRFGKAVALGEGRAVIGAYALGAAYAFIHDGSSWTESQRLVASEGASSNLFGWSVSLAGHRALVGAWYDDNLRGAAYAYAFGLANGEPCSADGECASGRCVDERCCNTDCSGSCGACSTAEGAREDGTCTIFSAGSTGSPACHELACNGESLDCAPCESDEQCSDTRYCAADQTCQPRREQGEACNDAVDEDCFLEGCRACESGFCVDGVCCDEACEAACEACSTEIKGDGEDGECGVVEAEPDAEEGCTEDGAANGVRCASNDDCASGHCTDGVCCNTGCDDTCEGCTAALKGEGDDGTCGHVVAGLNPPISSSDATLDCEESATCLGPTCDGEGGCDCAPGCATAEDCSPGATCDPNGVCVSAPKGGDQDDDSGCGCRTLGSSRFAPRSWLGVTLALLLFTRRLRTRRAERAKVRRAPLSSALHFSP